MELKDLRHLAELSKLEFTDDELMGLSKDFESLIELADQVKNSDVKGVRFVQSMDMADLRNDEPKQSTEPSELLQNAPLARNDCFTVPRIVE